MIECHNCGKDYDHVAQHWAIGGGCSYPKIEKERMDILRGHLMSDGWLHYQGKNPSIETSMTTPNYLRYLHKKFSDISLGVVHHMTARESAAQARESGFIPEASEENFSDKYRWHTTTHPQFSEFEQWYASGQKVWPEDIEITPEVLTHLFVGDGTYRNKSGNNYIKIKLRNEIDNKEKINTMFKQSGLPEPNNWNDGSAVWNTEESEELFDFMNEAPPDFKYKFPQSD